MEVVIKNDGTIWYSNVGFDYPLKDLAAFQKLYKEMRNMELKPASHFLGDRLLAEEILSKCKNKF